MITVIPEPEVPGPPYEHCVFCRKPTKFWADLPDRTPSEQVACCKTCAASHESAEVLSKDAWFEKEAALERVTPVRRPGAKSKGLPLLRAVPK